MLKGEYELVEIPREDCEQLEEALKEMNTPYRNAEEFMVGQVREALEKYGEWKHTRRKS
jgi:hypothetical protein